MSSHNGPLNGLLVVELAEALAGPYASMILGDLGAEVIKIERPGIGDQSRSWGPPFINNESAYFLGTNRNKKSITIDLKNTLELKRLHKLLAQSDVFITNLHKVDRQEKFDISFKQLTEKNPKLIYAAISGYGFTGYSSELPGYDILAQASSGLMTITGEDQSKAVRFPTPMADISAGVYSVISILSALIHRSSCGKGQFIDVSLSDSQMTWLANIGSSYLNANYEPEPLGNIHPTITPYQPFMAKDKYLIIATGTQKLWQELCNAINSRELIEDSRFIDNASRNNNRKELVKIIEEKLSSRNAIEWIELLNKKEIPCGPINTVPEALTDKHALSRNMIIEFEHPVTGLIKNIGSPINLSLSPVSYRFPPPLLGEHTQEIIESFNLDK